MFAAQMMIQATTSQMPSKNTKAMLKAAPDRYAAALKASTLY